MSLLAQGLQAHWTPEALAALARARIGIAGAGGLGSNVAVLLARSGIRRMLLADHDRVEPSNLNRQCYWPEDVGRLKVEALRDRLLALEPELRLDILHERVTADRACALFRGCDVVVEALDQADSKAALCASLLAGGFYVVAASGIGGFGMPPMQVRRLGPSFVCVGDCESAVGKDRPPLAPRVMQAAALQADAVLNRIVGPGAGDNRA